VRSVLAATLLSGVAAIASGQTRGAELVREQKPVYPENLNKASRQGNVVLIGRIDRNGAVQDVRAVWTTHEQLVEPTMTAVKAWVFRPALKDGKPVEIAANIVFPFRIRDDKGKVVGMAIPGPALSALAIFPADAGGRRSAPEGFPVRAGTDPRVRVEASLDVPALPRERRLTVRVEAVSPSGRRLPVFEDTLTVAAKETDAKLKPFSAPIGSDWEDGIWMLRFKADKSYVGAGQFWLARDPDRFDFAAALRRK
jgi:Gram-negative bacterial TonB protein C-terminal